jgi:hypothetical protein
VVGVGQFLDSVFRDDERHVHRRTIVAQAQHCEDLARDLAIRDLGLSRLTIRNLNLLFLDFFSKTAVTVTGQPEMRPREELLPPATATFPCCMGRDEPLNIDWRRVVLILDRTWMLSMTDGRLFLSKLAAVFERRIVDQCAFAISAPCSDLIARMPPMLRISQAGANWPFTRTAPTPALGHLTQLAAIDRPDRFLFTPAFFHNDFAVRGIGAVLEVVAQMAPTTAQMDAAIESLKWTFSCCRPQDRTWMQGVPPNVHPTQVHDRLITELEKIITLFAGASGEHTRLAQAFEQQKKIYLQATFRAAII